LAEHKRAKHRKSLHLQANLVGKSSDLADIIAVAFAPPFESVVVLTEATYGKERLGTQKDLFRLHPAVSGC
jgi:predicted DNA-binding ArsR family transcriptional regulator